MEDCVDPGGYLEIEGVPLEKSFQVTSPPVHIPAGRRRLLLLRFGVVVGLGSLDLGTVTAPEGGILVGFLQWGEPITVPPRLRAPLSMGQRNYVTLGHRKRTGTLEHQR